MLVARLLDKPLIAIVGPQNFTASPGRSQPISADQDLKRVDRPFHASRVNSSSARVVTELGLLEPCSREGSRDVYPPLSRGDSSRARATAASTINRLSSGCLKRV